MEEPRAKELTPGELDALADDDRVARSAGQRLLNLGGLVLIAAVFLALMMRIGGGGDGSTDATTHPRDAVDRSPAIERSTHATLPPLMLPDDPAIPDREPLAGLPGAIERFGGAFSIRHPTYLPADVAPFTVNWQPDSQPERRAQGVGELFTWFYSAEHGAVLVLAQGPGAGVWPLTAGDDRAGRVRLADGTEAVWVIGHPTSVTGGGAGRPVWEGTEITLGVPATNGDGWYLRSPIVSLGEMIRIADSLQVVTKKE